MHGWVFFSSFDSFTREKTFCWLRAIASYKVDCMSSLFVGIIGRYLDEMAVNGCFNRSRLLMFQSDMKAIQGFIMLTEEDLLKYIFCGRFGVVEGIFPYNLLIS